MTNDYREHYSEGVEEGRVDRGTSSLEFERTKELLERFLPPPPARVLDVGGGPGAYAAWLTKSDYQVRLIDPVPLHVEQAMERAARLELRYTAALGDAKSVMVGPVPVARITVDREPTASSTAAAASAPARSLGLRWRDLEPQPTDDGLVFEEPVAGLPVRATP
jgi:SAM-dependent methyltransferase